MPHFPHRLWVSLEIWLRDRHMVAYYLADFNFVQKYLVSPRDRRHTGKIILAAIVITALIILGTNALAPTVDQVIYQKIPPIYQSPPNKGWW